jgi:hypothetical protein
MPYLPPDSEWRLKGKIEHNDTPRDQLKHNDTQWETKHFRLKILVWHNFDKH